MKRGKKSFKDLKYEVTIVWDKENGGKAYIRNFPPLELDMPVEFGGNGKHPCPGEVFLSAIGGCLL